MRRIKFTEQGKATNKFFVVMGLIALAVHLFGDVAIVGVCVLTTYLVVQDLVLQWKAC